MRYVNDHHGAEYEWFLRLDDDAYVHIEHLESLLRRIDSDQVSTSLVWYQIRSYKTNLYVSLFTLDNRDSAGTMTTLWKTTWSTVWVDLE